MKTGWRDLQHRLHKYVRIIFSVKGPLKTFSIVPTMEIGRFCLGTKPSQEKVEKKATNLNMQICKGQLNIGGTKSLYKIAEICLTFWGETLPENGISYFMPFSLSEETKRQTNKMRGIQRNKLCQVNRFFCTPFSLSIKAQDLLPFQ